MYEIIWTESAKSDYTKIIDYLLSDWSKNTALSFKDKVDKKLSLISRMPKIYPKTEFREDVHRCVVVKQISLYYLEVEINKEIIVLRFYDNRSNPNKLNDIINKNVK